MPWMIQNNCVYKENEDGSAGELVKCHETSADAKAHLRALYANMESEVMKYRLMVSSSAVKAVGDWELDVLAVPFGKPDSDGQTFDAATDFMLGEFPSPAIIYHHGVVPGKVVDGKDLPLQQKPVIIGKTIGIETRSDGLHLRVLLDKGVEWARKVWEAAKQGIAVASSDSISHLARLESGGRRMMYEKNRRGRIAVWPLAMVSLWDKVAGNLAPASHYALALPAVKAIYRDAQISFPDNLETHGAPAYADKTAAERAEKKKLILQRARKILAQTQEKRP